MSDYYQAQQTVSRYRQPRVVKQQQTSEERLRRIAVSMMRTLARDWSKDYLEIAEELLREAVATNG